MARSLCLCSSLAVAPSSCGRAAPPHRPIEPPVFPSGGAAWRVNINRATADELEALPGIGPTLAARIVEHRERYGRFRRVEHLIMVHGFSESRFNRVRPYIGVD